MATKRIQVKVGKETAELANEILANIGLTQSEAINMFFEAIVNEGGMPFQVKTNTNRTRVLDTDEKVLAWLNEEEY
ncbi:type II toxin-antitoxin system RelB/DinJ family antitoxin [Ligilactobacillus equi]